MNSAFTARTAAVGPETTSDIAQFSHIQDGDWEEMTLSECLALVESGKAHECFDHANYDDGLRNFHCSAPCELCDHGAA